MAGTGKSAIARTVVNDYYKTGQLSVRFSFTRGAGDLASSAKLFTSIARQLADKKPRLPITFPRLSLTNTGLCDIATGADFSNILIATKTGWSRGPFKVAVKRYAT